MTDTLFLRIWDDNNSINELGDARIDKTMIFLDNVKKYLLERIGKQDRIAKLEWSNSKVLSLMLNEKMPRHMGGGEDSLEQLKHLIYWSSVNVAFFSVKVKFTLITPGGEDKQIGLAENTKSQIQLDSNASVDDAIKTLALDENSSKELSLNGINPQQWHIPVINQLLVRQAGGGYKIQGYTVNEMRENEDAFDNSKRDDESLCHVCYSWAGSGWNYCEICTPVPKRLSDELKEFDLDTLDNNLQDVGEGVRYKSWWKRKRCQETKHNT